MTEKLFCDCQRYCNGGRLVSRSTYYDHKPHRHQLTCVPSVPPVQDHEDSNKRRRIGNGALAVAPATAEDPRTATAQQLGDHITDQESAGAAGSLSEGNSYAGDLVLDEPREQDGPTAQSDDSPHDEPTNTHEIDPNLVPNMEELKIALDFHRFISGATLGNGDLGVEELEALQNPLREVPEIDNDNLLLSLKLFISTTNASNQVYNDVRADIMDVHPEDDLLSHHAIKKKILEMTGITPIIHDMCPNSCLAYTGPFAKLEVCPTCEEPRYDPVKLQSSGGRVKKSRQQFYTMPLGPQLQALYRTPEGARSMEHRKRCTQEIMEELKANGGRIKVFDDVYHGAAYLHAVDRGDIGEDDIVLMFSMDGAQLYQDKASDCWIYIWVVYNLAPDQRYKKKYVIPGGVIPGPNNPKNTDSFLCPGFHHLVGLQKAGLPIWHGGNKHVFKSFPYLYLGSADGPGSVHFTGLVGHQGAYLCRLYCGLKGRHKQGASTYYPALLKPDNYTVAGCDHNDIDPGSITGCSPEAYYENLKILLASRGPTDYKTRRKDTGISTISIFMACPRNRRQPIPAGFGGDCMHAGTINLGDLFPPLWRGTFTCTKPDTIESWEWAVLKSEVWKTHGAAVERCKPFLPGSYDRPPRNIAEKISSGYKAKEWQGYFYGLAPALLHGILPKKYWQNFCKLVYSM